MKKVKNALDKIAAWDLVLLEMEKELRKIEKDRELRGEFRNGAEEEEHTTLNTAVLLARQERRFLLLDIAEYAGAAETEGGA